MRVSEKSERRLFNLGRDITLTKIIGHHVELPWQKISCQAHSQYEDVDLPSQRCPPCWQHRNAAYTSNYSEELY